MADECPQCGSTERVLTARRVHDEQGSHLVGAAAAQVAPPPAPPEPMQADPGGNANLRWRWLLTGGYLAAIVIVAIVGAVSGAGAAHALRWVPFPGVGLLVLLFRLRHGDREPRLVQDQAVRVGLRAAWTRRMQVWEHARICLACPGAFWPAGSLKKDYPASPLFPLEQLPVMVVTMAERAYGPQPA